MPEKSKERTQEEILDDILDADQILSDTVVVNLDEQTSSSEESENSNDSQEGSDDSQEENTEESEEEDNQNKEEKEKKEKEGKKEGEDGDEGDDDGDEEGDGDEERVIDIAIQHLGYDFGDEEFEDNPQGFARLAERTAELKYQENLERLKQENPDAHDLFKFVEGGGNVKDYVDAYAPGFDFTEVSEISSDNKELQRRIVRESLKQLPNLSEDDIKDQIEEFEAANLLESQAKRMLPGLQKSQKDRKEGLLDQQRQARETQIKNAQSELDDLSNLMREKGQVSGIPVTDKMVKEFEQLTKLDEEGNSKFLKKMEEFESDPANNAALMLFIMYNGDMQKFIDEKAKSKRTKSFTEQLNKNKETSSSRRQRREESDKTAISADDIDYEKIGVNTN